MVTISPDRKMYLECRGSGSPTVVLVPGLVAAADTWSYVTNAAGASRPSPKAVYPRVGTFTRVCSYDRPGTARENGSFSPSTPVAQPTTVASDAADLHTLLAAARVKGPYVLVGWSFGGPIARFYASTYPEGVAGLVLVDGTSEYLQNALSPANFATFLKLTKRDDAQRVAEWKDVEQFDPAATFAQLRASPRVATMPVVVLTADKFDADAFGARLPAGREVGPLRGAKGSPELTVTPNQNGHSDTALVSSRSHGDIDTSEVASGIGLALRVVPRSGGRQHGLRLGNHQGRILRLDEVPAHGFGDLLSAEASGQQSLCLHPL
jgi:pimeloyl-ACP methyl ester carboxylesterase